MPACDRIPQSPDYSKIFSANFFLNLASLGDDHEAAVGLGAVLVVIILVVVLRRVELRERFDLGHDRRGEIGGELRDGFLGRLFLLFAGVKDDRAVLRPAVVALPVFRGRVVRGEEDLQQVLVADITAGSNSIFDHLGVPGPPGADLLVAGLGGAAARVAGHDRLHALQALEDGLGAPEASAAEDCVIDCPFQPSFFAGTNLSEIELTQWRVLSSV